MSAEFDFMTATDLARLVRERSVSPVALTARALERAEATRGSLNAFFETYADGAMADARAAEAAVMAGRPLGPLHGLPFSAKDLMAVGGRRYASGSRAMAENVAPADAPAVERARAAGAVLIGKTTTSEFGCKPVGDSPLTGITRNPWDPSKTPGGSSAGAAASVAAGITPFGLGTDGGGSVRIPCAFTGLAGIKGQFGRVPVWPTSATPTLAHVGPMARNVRDAALLFSVVAGPDARDPASVQGAVPDVLGACDAAQRDAPLAGLRIAYSPTLGYARPDADVVAALDAAAPRFEALGARVERVDAVFDADPADLWTAEFYAGVGTRLREVVESRRGLLDPAVAEVLDLALAQEMRAYYATVFDRYALRERMRLFFERHDLLLSPVLPVSALDVGVNVPAHLADRNLVSWVFYTYPFNLTGQPAVAVCAGLSPAGMPIGLQLAAGAHREHDAVRAAAAYEAAMPEGYNRPPRDGTATRG